jgi:hypothetical protein
VAVAHTSLSSQYRHGCTLQLLRCRSWFLLCYIMSFCYAIRAQLLPALQAKVHPVTGHSPPFCATLHGAHGVHIIVCRQDKALTNQCLLMGSGVAAQKAGGCVIQFPSASRVQTCVYGCAVCKRIGCARNLKLYRWPFLCCSQVVVVPQIASPLL